jgi:hypothetical protein
LSQRPGAGTYTGILPETAAGTVWLAQLGPHTGYAAGVLGPLILAAIGTGTVTAPSISTGTFGVAPQDVGVAFATVTVGQQLGASVGTQLLNILFAGPVSSYLTANLAAARIIGRQTLTGLALAHGYHTAFWWHLCLRRRHRRRPAPPRGRLVSRARPGTCRGVNRSKRGRPNPA